MYIIFCFCFLFTFLFWFQVIGVVVLMVAGEVSSDAFFTRFLKNNNRRPHPKFAGAGAPRHPSRSVKSYGGGKSSPVNYPPNQQINRPRPQYPKKPVYPTKPGKPYPKAPYRQAPRPAPSRDPGSGQRLDYSGWKPIGFDEKLPAKLAAAAASAPVSNYAPPPPAPTYQAAAPPVKTYGAAAPASPVKSYPTVAAPPPVKTYTAAAAPIKTYTAAPVTSYAASPVTNYAAAPAPKIVSDIVTLDVAIANAPKAESDDISAPAPVYAEPPPEPIVKESSFSIQAPVPKVTYVTPSKPKTRYTVVPVQKLPAPSKPQRVVSSYGAAVPAVPYIPSTADTSKKRKPQYNRTSRPKYTAPKPQYKKSPAPQPSQYQAPAPATSYQAVPASAAKYTAPAVPPKYEAPAVKVEHSAPAPAPTYSAPAPAPAYKAPPPPFSAPAKTQPTYNVPLSDPTKAPVVLPAYTPAPETYDPNAFGGEEFPIISLITGDSNVPEEDQYVSFVFDQGSEYSKYQDQPTPVESAVQYQNTADASKLAEEVSSGSVYVQPAAKEEEVNADELYYIYYQDPELDPSYGAKIQSERSAVRQVSATLDASNVPPARDIPLYDYDEAEYNTLREVRAQDAAEYFGGNYHNIGGHSSVSVNYKVGGKLSGFSYNL